jgi:hypothetical protein
MDDFDIGNIGGDEELNAPIPFDDDTDDSGVSHAPLDLGGGSAGEVEAPKEQASAPRAPAEAKPVEVKAEGGTVVSSERVTGVKTFFTKLHAGAIDFLDGQISNWLKTNPNIRIKRTNTVTGEVQGKKTEPNIIITVWY